MSAKVWGNAPSNVQQPVSFRDLMSEELAHKIEKDDQEPNIPLEEENIDEDLRLALELSKLEAEGNTNNNSTQNPTPGPHDMDADFILAMKLQEEEQKLAQQTSHRNNGSSLAKGL
jgi:hypothetical protein